VPATGYPPPDHILRDLGIRVDVPSASTAVARLPWTPQVAGADGGVRAGVLAVLVDLAAGAAAVRVLHPDWMATADLVVQLGRPAIGSWVEARAEVVRRGRTTLVVEAGVLAGDGDGRGPAGGRRVGMGTVTMAVLPARRDGPGPPGDPTFPSRSEFGADGLTRPLAEVVGVRTVEEASGRLSMPVVPYVHNSFGAAQGGVMALLGELAALGALGAGAGPAGLPPAGTVTDLEVAYLALGRVGPIVSEARVLASSGGGGRAVVELFDAGADGRLTTRCNVAVAAGGRRRRAR